MDIIIPPHSQTTNLLSSLSITIQPCAKDLYKNEVDIQNLQLNKNFHIYELYIQQPFNKLLDYCYLGI